ncbi:MAG: acyl carrier protein [Lachnospiraceae bacterium]|nr:acyl carrier protein [Lachnospiraceae bacterium]
MNEYMNKALELISEYADCDGEITADSQLIADLGINSLELMEIITDIEEKNNLVISNEELKNVVTVGDIAELMKAKGI